MLNIACSYRQNHWDPTEVDRDHEAQQSAGEATAAASDHAQHEYGDDEGIHTFTACSSGSLLLILTYLTPQAGIMSEMLDDTMESLDEDAEDLDEEADQEVEKVLFDITNGKLGEPVGKVGNIPVRL